MVEYKDIFATSGFLLIGMLMTVVSVLTLSPGSVAVSDVNAFRIYGGIGMIAAGILVAAFKGPASSAFVLFVNGVLFIIAGEISIAADSPVIIAIAVIYFMMAAVVLLSSDGPILVAIATAFLGLNLVCRYLMTPDDGVYLASGVFCILTAVVSYYIGIAISSERIELPLI